MVRKTIICLIATSLLSCAAVNAAEPPTGAPASKPAAAPPTTPQRAPAAQPPAPPPPAVATADQGAPALATLQGMMAVELKKNYGAYYGGSTIYGQKSPKSDDKVLVLMIPGGEIRVPRSAIERITPVAPFGETAAAVPTAAGSLSIRTTHAIYLKNGQVIRGSVVPGPENEPLKVDISSMGRIVIPRSRIAKVEVSPGEIRLPAAESPEPPEPPAAEKPTPSASSEGEKPAAAATSLRPMVTPELKAEIQEYLHNLTRWRHRDRTWAESRLAAIGAPAIPFLRGLARDPYELTRRAVMRIVRDVGDPTGIPIAIEGLLDEDSFVRETAAEALRKITGLDLGYRPNDPVPRRLDSYRRWRQWLEEQQ